MSPAILIGVGLAYTGIFWTVAIRKPSIALMMIFAAAPFQNDISGGGPLRFSIAEINLLLSVPIVFYQYLFRSRRIHFGPTLVPALCYLGACLFSSVGQWRGSSLTSLIQIGLYTVITIMIFATLARDVDDYRAALNGLMVVATIIAITVCIKRTGYVYDLHKNGVGASLATSFIIAMELWLNAGRKKIKWFYLGSALVISVACLITLSRGAWLAAITGTLIILAMRRRFGLMIKCVLVLVPVVTLGWNLLPEDSRKYAMGFDEKRLNIRLRYESIDYAKSLFFSNPLQGAGIGLRKDYDATNLVLLTLAESGVPGLATFFLLHAVIAWFVWMAYRRTPPNTLSASLLALGLALILSKFVHGLVDHYWSRGSLTVAWASVGMATRVAYDQRQHRKHALRERARQKIEEGEKLEIPSAEPVSATFSS